MDSHTLIQALIYLGAAALIVPIAVRLGLGSVLGYLIAGCIIGRGAAAGDRPRRFCTLPRLAWC
jgi:Kef-type K+ transport system membrane component KefB